MDTGSIVGYGASLCSIASFVPQAIKVIKTGKTEAISAGMYVLTVTGFALWTGFGLLREEVPIILTNAICFCLSSFILLVKLRAQSHHGSDDGDRQ
jgi:MtN3 and saliva related transmembrane protein